MALNQKEKELLAVVRYFNQEVENKHVARLVAKLSKDFNPADVKALTGFGENEIKVLIDSVTPKFKVDKKVQKIRKDAETAIEELDNQRLAIHLNADSDLPQRVAYDIASAIEKELSPGNAFWNQKEIQKRFECTNRTAGIATKILVSHNWIEQAEPGNFRKGYVIR